MIVNRTKRNLQRIGFTFLICCILFTLFAVPKSAAAEKAAETTPLPSSFEVHYIDVGQGDASLILCDGKAMLIDGGTPKCSRLIVAYLKKLDIKHLDYVIASHAHEDHIGGLSGALNACTVGCAYAPVTQYNGKAFKSFQKYVKRQGLTIQQLRAGASFTLGSSSVSVLAPLNTYDDHNDNSIVLKITYGNTSFLFTGDANDAAEHDLLNANADLRASVLKVGHHGSDDATSYRFLREIMPRYAVISCGAGNAYGHPTDTVLSRLRDAGATVYRTDLHGDIICTSNGSQLSFKTEKQAQEDKLLQSGDTLQNEKNRENSGIVTRDNGASTNQAAVGGYIGNINSHKFHRDSCNSLPAEKNRIYLPSREAAISAGYSPCKRCKP